MSVGKFGLAVGADVAGTIHQGHHRLSQRFRPCRLGIVGLPLEQIRDQLPRRFRIDRPIGDKHRTRAGAPRAARD
jgi:hypothetical protein